MEAVLFDWRGTLVADPPHTWWLERALSGLGRQILPGHIEALATRLDAASRDSDIEEGFSTEDCDPEVHREFNLAWFERAGLDDELALSLYEQDFSPECHPFYRDVPEVLSDLHTQGVGIAVVSDIHFDLRPEFVAAGLDPYVDAFVLSYEHGFQKPDPRMFMTALDLLGVAPSAALMVGDRASHDGGAAAVGITTVILPPLGSPDSRGLHRVVRLLARQ